MQVVVVPNDPRWGEQYHVESAAIARALGANLHAVHHIGSTSIASICAKPIIDMLGAAGDLTEIDRCNDAMIELGYEPCGEFGISGRRYFRKDDAAGIRTHHLHIFTAGSPQIERHLAFRDFLIAHPDRAREYSELKQRLAAAHPGDIEAYMDGKDAFIRETDRLAAVWSSSNRERA